MTPAPLDLPHNSEQIASDILWQTKANTSRGTSLTAPFIVPSSIEYLRRSRWSKAVSIVRGEAETFCASAAKATGAAVLSNDSDFTLLADMQGEGIVGMLHSLHASRTSNGQPSALEIQCWRPKRIRERLGREDLLRVGFERSKDPTASFATILQRSVKPQNDEEAAELARFTEQFRQPRLLRSETRAMDQLRLSDLDPRLAELICQLTESKDDSSIFQGPDPWVTLPMLLEDPSKDASWIYGQELRQLSYSLLSAALQQPKTAAFSSVTEHIRKGQRITQEIVEMIGSAGNKISKAIQNCIADLMALMNSTSDPGDSGTGNPRDYILWALATVLKQRATEGKSIMPSSTIRAYLGLSDSHGHLSTISKKSKSPQPDIDAEWRLLHLNANVQAVLYSLRILRQTCIFLRTNTESIDASYEADFTKLSQMIEHMPPIQDLFLDVDSVRSLMQQNPLSTGDHLYRDIFPDDVSSSKGSTRSKVIDGGTNHLVMERAVRKKRKKHGRGDRVGQKPATRTESYEKHSKNPFDLLMKD